MLRQHEIKARTLNKLFSLLNREVKLDGVFAQS